jgi:hypothetical protein
MTGDAGGDAAWLAVPRWGAAPVVGWYSASGTTRAGLADGEGAAADDTAGDDGAAVLWAPTADAAGGTMASWWLPPEVTVSVTPTPVMASTPAAVATADRKLSSSIRA